MAKKKNTKRWEVNIFGMIPASTTIEVEADTEEEAKELAVEQSDRAKWDGGDYTVPDGHTVEAGSATEIA